LDNKNMSIPHFSKKAINAFFTHANAVFTAICTMADAFWLILTTMREKVRKAVAPIFNPPGLPQNGSVGKKPFAPDVRILFVNGVGTTLESCRRTANAISRIFNDCLVHYTYLPLRYDQVLRTIMYGHRPASCDLLLSHIRERLHELVQTEHSPSDADRRVATVSQHALEQNPRLVAFVHSGGGAMLEAIREELTPEERSHIEVYSFGSAHMFSPAEGFENVKNAVAGGDPVPPLCRLIDRRIFPLGEAWNIGPQSLFNMSNHSILNDIYQLAMWHIRENCVQTS
jgi:hypothetical protein